MTLEGFSNKYNLNVNFIDCHGLINTVPTLQKVHNAVSDSLHFIKRWFAKIIL
jgi:hypothetical protein